MTETIHATILGRDPESGVPFDGVKFWMRVEETGRVYRHKKDSVSPLIVQSAADHALDTRIEVRHEGSDTLVFARPETLRGWLLAILNDAGLHSQHERARALLAQDEVRRAENLEAVGEFA